MKLVVDNNVMVSGFLWGGRPYEVLARIESGKDLLFTSRSILLELERILRYPKFDDHLLRVGISSATLLTWVVEHATLILPKAIEPAVVPADPSDNMLLECAWSGGVDILVTGDKRHLLPMKQWRTIQILNAAAYLDLVGS